MDDGFDTFLMGSDLLLSSFANNELGCIFLISSDALAAAQVSVPFGLPRLRNSAQ